MKLKELIEKVGASDPFYQGLLDKGYGDLEVVTGNAEDCRFFRSLRSLPYPGTDYCLAVDEDCRKLPALFFDVDEMVEMDDVHRFPEDRFQELLNASDEDREELFEEIAY
jgi:hypothetical protein